MKDNISNENARKRWNTRAVGAQRSQAEKGSRQYFKDIRNYRYGYETPFIPKLLLSNLQDKDVLEIGVGNGIDAVEIVRNKGNYSGIDITENHLELTETNLEQNGFSSDFLLKSDLLNAKINKKFDVVYSFGVLHHIAHEEKFLRKIRTLLKPSGELRVGLYSKYSFFNIYMFVNWIIRNRCSVSFNKWQGKISDNAEFDYPITIKIRTKSEILKLYKLCGFEVIKYYKRGFVQNYIPFFGRFFNPGGGFFNRMGAFLGWYHVIIFRLNCHDDLEDDL